MDPKRRCWTCAASHRQDRIDNQQKHRDPTAARKKTATGRNTEQVKESRRLQFFIFVYKNRYHYSLERDGRSINPSIIQNANAQHHENQSSAGGSTSPTTTHQAVAITTQYQPNTQLNIKNHIHLPRIPSKAQDRNENKKFASQGAV